jgi:hypothetical protein
VHSNQNKNRSLFGKEHYQNRALIQKRPEIFSSLQIVATSRLNNHHALGCNHPISTQKTPTNRAFLQKKTW